MSRIPDIGECFQHGNHLYRVTGWVRLVKQEPLSTNDSNPGMNLVNEIVNELLEKQGAFGKMREQWCLPEEATHVSGAGVAGCIVRIDEVEWENRIVKWEPEWLESDRKRAISRAGQWVY